jgi:hypothetical protein
MDVYLDDSSYFLRNRVLLEGDSIAPTVEKANTAISLSFESFPVQVLEALRLDVEIRDKPDFFVVRWIKGNEWITEPLVIIPIYGMFNDNGGKDVLSGAASRVLKCDKIDNFFDVIKQSFVSYDGACTVGFSNDLRITHLAKGIPEWLYANVLNAHRNGVSDFFDDPSEGYFFSGCWTIGILISRFPYPFVEETEEVAIRFKRDLLRRVWDFGWDRHKGGFLFRKTKLGIVTTYSNESLKKANELGVITCRNIEAPMKQYRTDLDQEAGRRWAAIHSSLEL